jgi:glycine betaine transporter
MPTPMWRSPLLISALAITGAVALWGIVDNRGLATLSSNLVGTMFTSRGWFIMLTASVLLIACFGLALSRYGEIRLGADDDRPEFSTVSWLTMLFAAGMGVGLLYWGAAEPITHYTVIADYMGPEASADAALFVTNFHWGLHAWAIYAVTGLVIAYFGFRRGCPILLSAPLADVLGDAFWVRALGWWSDLMAIVAIAIGLGGSIAMGVFQVQGGLVIMVGLDGAGAAAGMGLALAIFVVLCIVCVLPLMVDLSAGMAHMSNTAMAIAGFLVVFVLLTGPTHFIMSAITEGIGGYAWNVLPHGFRTYTFFDERVTGWFQSWTLTYMVWWLAWSPFVGVFIARISRGRTIREYVLGVVLVPTAFSIFWFGTFGSMGFYEAAREGSMLLEVVTTESDKATFHLLDALPLGFLTSALTLVAAFLFIVTSVVSAAFVLGMFSTGGDPDPSTSVKLIWGVILGALGLVMILSDSIDTVKSIIALGAMPFVFIVLVLLVCLLKALKKETPA